MGTWTCTNEADFNCYTTGNLQDIGRANLGEAGYALAGFMALIVLVVIIAWFVAKMTVIKQGTKKLG